MGAKVMVFAVVGADHARGCAFVRREVSGTCVQEQRLFEPPKIAASWQFPPSQHPCCSHSRHPCALVACSRQAIVLHTGPRHLQQTPESSITVRESYERPMGAKVLILLLVSAPQGRSRCAFAASFVADQIFGDEIDASSARV